MFISSSARRLTFIQADLLLVIMLGDLSLQAQATNTTNGASTTPAPPATPPLTVAPTAAPGISLVSNSDFSRTTKEPTWPDGWSHPAGATWEAEYGIHFVRLTSPSPGATVLMYRQMDLPNPLPPGIELRVRVRYSNVNVGTNSWFDAQVMGNFRTTEGKNFRRGGKLPAPAFQGTSAEWVDKSVFARVPPIARQLAVMPCLLQASSST